MTLISNWINPNSTFKYSLLYKATRDGDSVNIFHDKCDSVNNTIVLISTTEGWKFGGYTDSSWKDPRDYWFEENEDIVDTNNTFIFSLNLHKKYPSIYKSPKIRCGFDKGPNFGDGPDIMIVNKFFKIFSTCNSPMSFGNMEKPNEFNGGTNAFIVKDIEVFHVEDL